MDGKNYFVSFVGGPFDGVTHDWTQIREFPSRYIMEFLEGGFVRDVIYYAVDFKRLNDGYIEEAIYHSEPIRRRRLEQ